MVSKIPVLWVLSASALLAVLMVALNGKLDGGKGVLERFGFLVDGNNNNKNKKEGTTSSKSGISRGRMTPANAPDEVILAAREDPMKLYEDYVIYPFDIEQQRILAKTARVKKPPKVSTPPPTPKPTSAPVPKPTSAPVPKPTSAPVPKPTNAPVPAAVAQAAGTNLAGTNLTPGQQEELLSAAQNGFGSAITTISSFQAMATPDKFSLCMALYGLKAKTTGASKSQKSASGSRSGSQKSAGTGGRRRRAQTIGVVPPIGPVLPPPPPLDPATITEV